MATVASTETRKAKVGYPAHSRKLDALMGILTLVLISGLFIDGWAHNHGRVDDSFFTVYHAVMYSSYAILGAVLVGMQALNVNRGYAFWNALPKGYLISLVGVFVFAFGGFADMLWHEAFGIEEDIEALYSPSHLLLGVGYALVISGVIYSAWMRREPQRGWRDLWWVMLATTCLLSLFTFFTQFMSFVGNAGGMVDMPIRPEIFTRAVIGSYIITASIMIGVVLMILKRWRLPFGAITAIFGLNSLMMGLMLLPEPDNPGLYLGLMSLMVVPSLLAGLVADLLIWRLKAKPQIANPNRIVAAVVPFVLAGGYILAIQILGMMNGGGLWWEIHTWLGVPTLCAIAGLLLSMLAFPPAIPQEIPAD